MTYSLYSIILHLEAEEISIIVEMQKSPYIKIKRKKDGTFGFLLGYDLCTS